ncbi:MAG: hypothetical protein K6G32_12050, partial [Prevotella sp.]|nr:hypothetical protein [Prevotella sp.]
MKRIWNTFCEEISKNKGVKEMTFEKEIVKGFLQALGWSRYDGNLEEQYALYSRKWIPDFVFYLNNDKNAKEIILELKKPDHKQRKVDIEQIEAYMKLTDCRFGLYFGEKLEVFYLEERDGKRSAASVTTIDWTIDNEAGANLIELLDFKNYNREKLEQFCSDHLYLNSFLNLWRTQRGQKHLYEGIMEHFMLPKEMLSSLQSRLKFTIVDNPETEEKPASPVAFIPTTPQMQNGKGNVWLICYDKNYFDVEGCFKKYGQIYWRHKAGVQNVQKGDVAYLYSSSPESAIRFKVEVVESQIPYSPAVDEGDEFAKSASNDIDYSDKLFFLVRPIADTNSPALKHEAMMNQKLMGKRPSTTKLSKEEFKSLRQYIEQHFNDAVPANEPVVPAPAKKAKPKKQDKPKVKTDRRPPFKFSMIGLKPGDVVYFEHGDIPVTVVSENTVAYDSEIYTLS